MCLTASTAVKYLENIAGKCVICIYLLNIHQIN